MMRFASSPPRTLQRHSPNGFAANANNLNHHLSSAACTAPNHNIIGTKRLASCREELEQSWQTSAVTTHHPNDLHCVSNEDDSDWLNNSHRAKRRRTLFQSNDTVDDAPMMTECSLVRGDTATMECSFARGMRISPSSRPHSNHHHTQPLNSQVKSGWYEGEVDPHGNRHGKGITRHDNGTEYEGSYVNDAMEGTNGRFQFVTTRHLVPNPHKNGSHLHRQIEKSIMGTFKNDMPSGPGMIITKTTDCAPQVLGSSPVDIRFMEVLYDVGMHRQADGNAVGEGVRIIYTTRNSVDEINGGGRRTSTLEKTCFRLINGVTTNVNVADSYAAWILQCMGVDSPVPPSSYHSHNIEGGASWSGGSM